MQNLSLKKGILSLLFLSTAMLACNSSKESCKHSKAFSIDGAAELAVARRTAGATRTAARLRSATSIGHIP
ncbi:MAG: hypothetical protein NQ127_01425 [Candidatus Cardinium sp.]|nr:hypothetical protein [Candidatus Cardinium sp.]